MDRALVKGPRQPEVRDLEPPILGEHQILWLHVEMNHPLIMGILQSRRYLFDIFDNHLY